MSKGSYPEMIAERYRKQAVGTLTPLEVGLHETLDILRAHMLALEILAKEGPHG